jgi:hypothetical protein
LENGKAKDMWFLFQKWGKVNEFFIPNKRNKYGKRFGFVRFDGIVNPKDLELKLDNIFIGEMKLHVNLPRFNREKEVLKENENEGYRALKERREEGAATSTSNVRRNVSFAQAVAGGGKAQKEFPVLGEKSFEDIFHRSFKIQQKVVDRTCQCFVGKIKGSLNPFLVQEKVHELGFFNIKAIPMGNDMILLDSNCPEEISEFVEKAKDSWSLFLSYVENWSPNLIIRERLAWFNCYGIPVHAWSESFFKFLFFGRGVIVEIDEATSNKTALPDWCNRNVRVKINDIIYNIRLVEDLQREQEIGVVSCPSKLELDVDEASNFESSIGVRLYQKQKNMQRMV